MTQRKAEFERKSNETQIKVSLNIDGTGKTKIKTPIACDPEYVKTQYAELVPPFKFDGSYIRDAAGVCICRITGCPKRIDGDLNESFFAVSHLFAAVHDLRNALETIPQAPDMKTTADKQAFIDAILKWQATYAQNALDKSYAGVFDFKRGRP